MTPGAHILFLNEFYYPDICASAVVACDHASRIAALRPDWRISVIAGDKAWDDPTVIHPARQTHRGVEIIRVNRPPVSRTNLLRRAIGFAVFQRSAVTAARSLPAIDLVVATTAPPQGASIARRIAQERGCPYVYKVLDLYPDLAASLGRVRQGSFVYRRWLAADERAMREAAAVVCIAERMTRRLAQTRNIPRETLATIHDGFDPACLSLTGQNEFRRKHNPDERFVVQYAGNMGLSHPFGAILDAARRLEDDPRILFQFIGDGPQREMIGRSMPRNAQLIPYQPAARLGEVLTTADVCLISQDASMFDKALPYKVYGILAAGRPAIFIGDRRSEIVEWLEASGAGAHVNQDDPAGLVALIERYRASIEARSQAGAAAAKLFADRFDSRLSAAKWVDLFDQLLRGDR